MRKTFIYWSCNSNGFAGWWGAQKKNSFLSQQLNGFLNCSCARSPLFRCQGTSLKASGTNFYFSVHPSHGVEECPFTVLFFVSLSL